MNLGKIASVGMHDVLSFVEKHAVGVVHAAEALGAHAILKTAEDKKAWAVKALEELVDAFLNAHGLGMLDAPVNGMIENAIEWALHEIQQLGFPSAPPAGV